VGAVVVGAVNYALVPDWPSLNSAQVVFETIKVSLFTAILIALRLLPLWFLHRGSTLTAPIVSLYALAQVINAVRYPDLITVVIAIVFLFPAVLIWLPSSRVYLLSVRSERAIVAGVTAEPTPK